MRADNDDVEALRILAQLEAMHPLLAPAGLDWVLETDEVQALIEETAGDLTWLAWELNDQADRCALMWVPVDHGLGEPEYASFRRWAQALKVAAAVIGRERTRP